MEVLACSGQTMFSFCVYCVLQKALMLSWLCNEYILVGAAFSLVRCFSAPAHLTKDSARH